MIEKCDCVKCDCSHETRTCTYTPDSFLTVWDEDDNEIDTNEPSWDCCAFACSNCGHEMIYGDMGWFDEEPPHTPHFEYCPYCGFKVVNFYG